MKKIFIQKNFQFIRPSLIHSLLYLLLFTFGYSYSGYTKGSINKIRAIGDIQGDPANLEEILIKSQSVDERGHIQPGIHLVFMGDLIGKGYNSPAVIQKVMELVDQAESVGSKVTLVMGNHDFNYMHSRQLSKYLKDPSERQAWEALLPSVVYEVEEMIPLALMGNPITGKFGQTLKRFYETLVPMAVIGETLFIHSGLSEKLLDLKIEDIHEEFSSAMKVLLESGGGHGQSHWLFGFDGPTLTEGTADPVLKEFSMKPGEPTPLIEQEQLRKYFTLNHIKQMVVGHWEAPTIQEHSVYGPDVYHVDTGISGVGGKLSYLDFDWNENSQHHELKPVVWHSLREVKRMLNQCLGLF